MLYCNGHRTRNVDNFGVLFCEYESHAMNKKKLHCDSINSGQTECDWSSVMLTSSTAAAWERRCRRASQHRFVGASARSALVLTCICRKQDTSGTQRIREPRRTMEFHTAFNSTVIAVLTTRRNDSLAASPTRLLPVQDVSYGELAIRMRNGIGWRKQRKHNVVSGNKSRRDCTYP